MGDVSEKLMTQFANNLNTMLDAEADTPEEAAQAAAEAVTHATEVAAQAPAVTEPAAAEVSTPAAPAPAAAAAPTVRKIEGPAAEPIELSDLAGSAVLKRMLPVFGGIVLLLLVLRRLRK